MLLLYLKDANQLRQYYLVVNEDGKIRTFGRRGRNPLLLIPLSYVPKNPPCLCIVERHGRGRTYTKFGPPLPMKQSQQELLGLSSGFGGVRSHNLCLKRALFFQLNYEPIRREDPDLLYGLSTTLIEQHPRPVLSILCFLAGVLFFGNLASAGLYQF